jgi:hypothetical protein
MSRAQIFAKLNLSVAIVVFLFIPMFCQAVYAHATEYVHFVGWSAAPVRP